VRSFTPFISEGFVCLVSQSTKTPVKILCDTGANQSLILERVLPFSSKSFSGSSILLQGIELWTLQAPLHVVELSSEMVLGPVIVGLRSSLPVKGIDLVLGNDLAGGKEETNPCVSNVPHSTHVEDIPGLFPACAVTHAMAKKALNQVRDDTGQLSVEEVIVQPAEVPSLVPPSVSSETDSEPAQLRDEVEEVKNSVLSAQMLVREHKNDSELQQLREWLSVKWRQIRHLAVITYRKIY